MKNRLQIFALILAAFALFVYPVASGVVFAAANPPIQQPTDITVSPVQGPSVTQKLKSRAAASWPWYITRAAGIVAVILLVLLILSGIGLVTGYTFRFFEPLTAWATHKALGLALGVAVLIHVLVLLFDTYVPFTIAQALFPFASKYRPLTINGVHLGSFYVALGIFAFYGLALIILTSLFWIDKKPRIWKIVHIISYLVAILVFFHVLYLGTDITHGIVRTIWITFGFIVGVAMLFRLRRARSI